MSNPADEPAEVVEPATDPEPEQEIVPDPPADDTPPPDDDGDGIPDWGKDVISRLGTVEEMVTASAANPEDNVGEDPPGNGEEITFDSPAKKPWHKRGFFG